MRIALLIVGHERALPPLAHRTGTEERIVNKTVERRANRRSPCKVGIYCRSICHNQLAEFWPATVLDVSKEGVGLIAERRFEKGTLLFIELQAIPEYPFRTFLARVVRSCKQANGHWILGCMLTKQVQQDEVTALLHLSDHGWQAEELSQARR